MILVCSRRRWSKPRSQGRVRGEGRASLGSESGQGVEFPEKPRREIKFWTLAEGLGLGTAVLRRDTRDVGLHCVWPLCLFWTPKKVALGNFVPV